MILDFVSTLATSWPFIILVIVIFFHKEIGDNITKIFDLLTRLKSFSAGDKSITFSEQLASLDYESDDQTKTINNIKLKPDWGFTPNDDFEKLALLRPDFAILDSWRPIEKRLSSLSLKETSNVDNRPVSIGQTLNKLVERKFLTKQQFFYIREVHLLRNKVVHNKFGTLATEDAYDYRKKCMEIMQILDTIPSQQTH